ncbi:protein unc-45 homolog B [Diorhabda sublineata]|uniref:protein unc-45 homolog B n=1 Tax=Diorhabda sublineata TaxID=1163346 RepID=UPI0024E0B3DC|nr:protein unc-45 homolog B [Diorhabda sublineata]
MENENQAETFKEEGNVAFKNGDWETAIILYTKAINITNEETRNLSIYLKNRAAAYLKIEKYEAALNDCDKSLKIVTTDPKALFRRCQALEALQRYEEAYRDATQIFKDDPTNKTIQPILQRLFKIVQERARQNELLSSKLESMLKIAFDLSETIEKRETAMNNLLVLARQSSGAELMMKSTIVQQVKNLIKVDKNRVITTAGIRIIGELCKHNETRTKKVLEIVGLPWFLEILDSEDANRVNVVEHCMQTIINAFSGMENKRDTKPKKELIDRNKKQIDTLLTCLVYALNNRLISGLARDALIELIMRNINYDQLSWAEQLVNIGGVERLMECASELEEYKYESSMNITSSTRTVAAVCLGRIYENMYYDALKEKFREKIENFIKDKLLTPDIESKVRVTVALTALLRGPLDVGNALIGKEGIMEMILVMANTEDELQQKVACECIIAAASKADKAKAIISQGINILKQLYKSKNDHIRIRALVGLCKLGSSGGTDASLKPFAEGSSLKLAEACRRFLLHPGKDNDIRKWAAEGLSYLTLDAEVKEKLIEDKPALQALVELAKTGDQSVLFGVITTLVNLCNAYDKQEVIPEMLELAKFAKQHIPEEHELDDPDFVTKRILILGHANVTTALVSLAKTESDNSKELIARVFNAMCSEQELRGVVVAQGGSKALLSLALNGTEKGKRQAAQALARIGITMNPEIAFPGQKSLEVIRPLLNLLHPDCTGLENFEALMALCNMAQVSETARMRIIKEGGFGKIEQYMFEDHQQISRAAVQCMCNMTQSEEVIKMFEGENDRVKFAVALCLDEDKDTAMAAAGMLAIITGASKKCCEKVFDSKNWLDCLHCLLANPSLDMQYRGVCVTYNILSSSKEVAEKLIQTDVLEILMALSKLTPCDGREKIVEIAGLALQEAEKWGVIKKPGEDDD